MSDRPYHKHLAAILHKAQGVFDPQAEGRQVDIGGEILRLRKWCDESADRIAALEAENERLTASLDRANEYHGKLAERLEIRQDENAMPYDRIDLLEVEVANLRADLQGAEQRVLREFAE